MDRATLRRINREVAAKYLPELAQAMDGLIGQGFMPWVVSLSFSGEALAHFNQLVSEHEDSIDRQVDQPCASVP